MSSSTYSFDSEVLAGGIATCETYSEFLQYYRMLAKHGRPNESYRRSQKRAGQLWACVKTYRATPTPPLTPSYTPENSDDEGKDEEIGADTEENVCPMCNEEKPAADDDGHCSYECASGGGKSIKSLNPEIRRRLIPDQPTAKAPRVEEDEETLKEEVGTIGVTIAVFMALGYWLAMLYYGASSWSR